MTHDETARRAEHTPPTQTDDADTATVLEAILQCTYAWEGRTRLIGNIRAQDISRACREALALLSSPDAGTVGDNAQPAPDMTRERALLHGIIPEPTPDYTTMDAPTLLDACRDDASKWAVAFCQTAKKLGHHGIDEGWMTTWFANAIEHSHAVRLAPALTAALAEAKAELKRSQIITSDGRIISAKEWADTTLAEAKAEAVKARRARLSYDATISDLQAEIGRLQSVLQYKVLGDPRVSVSSTEKGQTTAEYLEGLPDQPFSARRP